MSKVRLVLLVVALSVLIGVSWWAIQRRGPAAPDTVVDTSADHACGLPAADTVAAQYTVPIIGTGFATAELSVKVGQTVRWVNQDGVPHHVASNPHPAHTDCLGFESADLAPDQAFSFTFTKAGRWGYHDHLNPNLQGFVVVTE